MILFKSYSKGFVVPHAIGLAHSNIPTPSHFLALTNMRPHYFTLKLPDHQSTGESRSLSSILKADNQKNLDYDFRASKKQI